MQYSAHLWSDILNAMTFLLADCRGFLTKAWRTRSMFSGVLSEGPFPGSFLFVADAVSLKFLTHYSRVLQLGSLSFRWMLKCRWIIHSVRTTESSFLKYVSTAKARCSTDEHSMANEMLWVSLEGCSKTNSPRQQFHSQLCCQIVRYFCWTLYMVSRKSTSLKSYEWRNWYSDTLLYIKPATMIYVLI